MTLHKVAVADVEAPRSPKLAALNRFARWAELQPSAQTPSATGVAS